MLRTVEYLCAYAGLVDDSYTYPRQELDEIWRTLLLNQFHDILPGSAISWVHRLAREDYRRDIARLEQIGDEAACVIASAQPQAPMVSDAKLVPMEGKGLLGQSMPRRGLRASGLSRSVKKAMDSSWTMGLSVPSSLRMVKFILSLTGPPAGTWSRRVPRLADTSSSRMSPTCGMPGTWSAMPC